MFDIGFSEIVVIAVVALIVIGPEKLPKTARTLGHLFGRLQRYVNDVKSDISREIELDELRRLQQEVKTAATDIETSVSSAMHDVETGVRNVESELNAAAIDAPKVGVDSPGTGALPAEMEPLSLPQPASTAAPIGASPASESEPPRQPSLPGFDRG
jgi:sec-independent protein translocase protein TatB